MEKSDVNKHIGNKFQEYRLKNNLTQNQVSELTGLEPRHISQIERGLSKGSIDTLLKDWLGKNKDDNYSYNQNSFYNQLKYYLNIFANS